MKRKQAAPALGKDNAKKARKAKTEVPVNQNWLQLQSKLHRGGKFTKKEDSESESDVVNAVLPKLPEPSSLDCSLTKCIAMDCEMVGVGHDGKKSTLARVSIVNEYGNVLYDKFVKPLEFVTDFRTFVSGIRYKDIKKGESFHKVQKEVMEIMAGRILVGHALQHDFKVLCVSHPKSDIRDTCLYAPFRSVAGRPRSLRHLTAQFLERSVQEGAHSSVEDARAVMLLYQKFKEEWEKGISTKHTRCKKKI